MKRRKDLEYAWILKGAFFVQAYTAKLENGKTFIVYAHDFNDMEYFLSRLEVNEAGLLKQLLILISCQSEDSCRIYLIKTENRKASRFGIEEEYMS